MNTWSKRNKEKKNDRTARRRDDLRCFASEAEAEVALQWVS